MTTQLGSKALMSIVKVKENNVAQEFFVVRHNAYASGHTLLLRRYTHSDRQWHTSDVNTYASCTLDAWFNGEYLNTLPADIRGQIAAVTIHYTPGNGNNALSSLSRKVFAVSATELGQSHQYMTVEGTALANASALKIATDSGGTAKAQWTRSPDTRGASNAWSLNSGGGCWYSSNCTNNFSARPAFTLPSSLDVDDNGNIVFNTPPTISGSDTNLGTKSTDFTQTYTVTDADTGDTVTVVEALDGVRLRSYTATLGAQNTFSVSGLVFQKLLNGNHTMTVTATDKSGAAATRRWTFTKAVNALSITLTAPLVADAMVTKCIVSVTREIPVGASFKVEVCNNGNDTAPTWEDCTSAVNANRKFFFTNTTKTAAKWGLNVRVSIARNNATGDCFVTSIGGNFE